MSVLSEALDKAFPNPEPFVIENAYELGPELTKRDTRAMAAAARRLAFPREPMARAARFFGVSRQEYYRRLHRAVTLGLVPISFLGFTRRPRLVREKSDG